MYRENRVSWLSSWTLRCSSFLSLGHVVVSASNKYTTCKSLIDHLNSTMERRRKRCRRMELQGHFFCPGVCKRQVCYFSQQESTTRRRLNCFFYGRGEEKELAYKHLKMVKNNVKDFIRKRYQKSYKFVVATVERVSLDLMTFHLLHQLLPSKKAPHSLIWWH